MSNETSLDELAELIDEADKLAKEGKLQRVGEAKEANLSKCSGPCGEIKPRIQNGKYPDGRNKKWVNEKGELWVGRRCPDCVKSSMKERMRKFRSKEVSDV